MQEAMQETELKGKCADCGQALSADALGKSGDVSPCPECGSHKREFHLIARTGLRLREAVRWKLKDPARSGKRKFKLEGFVGSEPRKSKDDFVYKERHIDRESDRYRELVRDEDGTVIRDVDEPLSEHIGRGSAKFAKGDPARQR
ncbi:MAG: hypothetical protein NXI21_12680 [Alphaproteobacteria bacterium]|nr:hypothetical protein [Alphaproteobacteria bacterium]